MTRATYLFHVYFILTVCTWYFLILTESHCVFIVWYETQKTCGSNNIHLKYAISLIIITDKLKQHIFEYQKYILK